MKEYLKEAIQQALSQMDGVPEGFEPELEAPRIAQHGDLATNCAMQLARHLRRAPLQIAEAIAACLVLDADRIARCEVVRPGFINFRFSKRHLYQSLAACLAAGLQFGRSRKGQGQRALVEFVSANPTGPLTVGHGRNAVLGDTIANLLEWIGYDVTREYYFNDAGRQMRVLGASVRGRYEQLTHAAGVATKMLRTGTDAEVVVPASFPDDGYLGNYIITIAKALAEKHGDALLTAEDEAPFTSAAKAAIFETIKGTLQRLGIVMDVFFNEQSLYDSGAVAAVLEALRDTGYIYQREGATWFKTSALGKDGDTVLVKSSGEPTYRLPDIAYHCDKIGRGFDRCIDVFGADHIATYPDILRALRLLKLDADRVEVIIYQFVTLLRGGKEVKMSTRKANFVTLDALITEVGADVARYFFLMRSAKRHLEFDLDLAKEASDKNPVFYLQYAHARICSIADKAASIGIETDASEDFSLLVHDAEVALIRQVVRFPSALSAAALAREPHRMIGYLREVAEQFSQFYHHCRILGEPRQIARARLALALAARVVLANGLAVLGITAPTSMERREERP